MTPETHQRERFELEGLCIARGLIDPKRCDETIRALSSVMAHPRQPGPHRVENAWAYCRAVRDLAAHEAVLEMLRELFGETATPFQTLNFSAGSQQPLHADAVHFDTLQVEPVKLGASLNTSRLGSICGVWIALEPVGPHQGPLQYLARSHHEETALSLARQCTRNVDYQTYEHDIAELTAKQPLTQLIAEPGDVVVWHAQLLHGGAEVQVPGSTRWSQVTHYCFGDAALINPMHSLPRKNLYSVRSPVVDIATGRRRTGSLPAGSIAVRSGLTNINPGPTTISQRSRSLMRWIWRRARFELSLLRLRSKRFGRSSARPQVGR